MRLYSFMLSIEFGLESGVFGKTRVICLVWFSWFNHWGSVFLFSLAQIFLNFVARRLVSGRTFQHGQLIWHAVLQIVIPVHLLVCLFAFLFVGVIDTEF